MNQQKITFVIERYYGWIIIGILTGIYAPLIQYWYDGWLHKNISIEHEYFSHGLIGLPFAAWIAWSDRKKWQRLPDNGHPLAPVLLLCSSIFYLTGVPDLVNLSFPIMLLGICLWLKGIPGLQMQGFPLLLVFLASPNQLPYLIAPYTLPLQSFIASVAGFILLQIGIDVKVEDIYLYVGDAIVEVAPYCAGLKILFSMLYVALMLLYWTDNISSSSKISWFLVTTVILSVTGNIIRNTFLTFFHGTGQEDLFVWLHESWGGDLYSACIMGLLIPILNGIEKLHNSFIEPAE